LNILKQHRGLLIIIALAAILFSSDIWAYKEFVRAESYFALGARLMVEQGGWLTPHAPDEQVLNKPPLTYWLIGISYKLFGVSYGSARLPSVIAALAVLAIVYAFGFQVGGIRAGTISAATLATSYLFLNFARMAMSDMLLTLFATASLSCFAFALRSGPQSNVVFLGYVSLALGVMTKGPIALILVALPIIFELLISRRRLDLKRLRLALGLPLLLVVAAPYFALVYAHRGAAPLKFFFFGENLQRFTGQVYGALGRPFWYEFAAFFSDFTPWSLLIFLAIWIDWRTRRGGALDRTKRIQYLWLASTILLFSISNFKLDYYLLPAMPAAALIIGPVFADKAVSPFLRRALQSFLIVCGLVVVLVALLSMKAAGVLGVESLVRFLPVAVALSGTIATGIVLSRGRVWAASVTLCGVMAATMLSMELALLPAFTGYLPVTKVVQSAANQVWYTSGKATDWANDLAFNLPATLSVVRLGADDNNEGLRQVLKNNPRAVVLVRQRDVAGLLESDPTLKILAEAETYRHGGITLKMLRKPERDRLLVVGH
jgi:4-amino-4-deoxy-L-arabinose transferase-like glycosyltransferase